MTFGQALVNVYFLVNAASLFAIIGLMIFMFKRTRISPTIASLQAFLVSAALISIYQMCMFFVNSSAKYDAVIAITPLYIVILGISFMYFGLNFIGKSSLLRGWRVMVLWASAIFILFLGWHTTNFIVANDYSKLVLKPWGYVDLGTARYSIFLIIWVQICIGIPYYLLFKYYRCQTSRLKKKQALLVLIGMGLPFIAGIIFEAILPTLHIFVPPNTSLGEIFLGVVVSYALIKYGSSSLDPEVITSNIVQTMNNAALGLNEELDIVYANQAASEFLGLAKDDLIGLPIKPFLTPGVWHEFSGHIKKPSDLHHSKRMFETTIAHQSGKRLHVNIYSSMYYDKDGTWRGAVLVMADIHRLHDLLKESESLGLQLIQEKKGVEQKVVQRTEQLAREQARFQASVNSLRQGFMIIDNDLNIPLINRAAQKMFIKSANKKLDLDQLDEKFGENLDIISTVNSVQKSHTSNQFQNVAFGARFLNVYITPVLSDEKIIGCVLLFDDVTEQRILARSKDEFFSIASHELRTPLTSIKGNTSMILNYYKPVLKDKDLKEMIVDVHDSSIRLIDIVNDFLDISRLEQGKMNFKYEAISVEAVVEEVAYEMQSILKEKHLYLKLDKLTLDHLPKVWADKNRLKQVIYNLVGNALKFTEEGGITIGAETHKTYVRVRVSDTGHGMTEASQQLLFHKFQQASSSLITRDTTRGTGLGLYISKMIVENMGGSIALDSSTANVGSTFSFKVPVATSERQIATNKLDAQTDTNTGLTKVQTSAPSLQKAKASL